MIVAYVALGGAIGAACRYLTVSAFTKWLGVAFPYGTLAVNILGSLFMGCVIGWLTKTLPHSMELRAFLVVGVLGGFTTFSAFSLDVVTLLENGALGQAILYVIASVLGAVLALFLAIWAFRAF